MSLAFVPDYLPWAVMCYSGVLLAWIYGFTGIGIARTTDSDSKKETARA